MAHNGHVADVDWDGWLDRLIDDTAARQLTDVRAYLIIEISRAMAGRDALRGAMLTSSQKLQWTQ